MKADRIFCDERTIRILKCSLPEIEGFSLYMGIPIYIHPAYPYTLRNGDIMHGVVVLDGKPISPIIEEVYRITTA